MLLNADKNSSHFQSSSQQRRKEMFTFGRKTKEAKKAKSIEVSSPHNARHHFHVEKSEADKWIEKRREEEKQNICKFVRYERAPFVGPNDFSYLNVPRIDSLDTVIPTSSSPSSVCDGSTLNDSGFHTSKFVNRSGRRLPYEERKMFNPPPPHSPPPLPPRKSPMSPTYQNLEDAFADTIPPTRSSHQSLSGASFLSTYSSTPSQNLSSFSTADISTYRHPHITNKIYLSMQEQSEILGKRREQSQCNTNTTMNNNNQDNIEIRNSVTPGGDSDDAYDIITAISTQNGRVTVRQSWAPTVPQSGIPNVPPSCAVPPTPPPRGIDPNTMNNTRHAIFFSPTCSSTTASTQTGLEDEDSEYLEVLDKTPTISLVNTPSEDVAPTDCFHVSETSDDLSQFHSETFSQHSLQISEVSMESSSETSDERTEINEIHQIPHHNSNEEKVKDEEINKKTIASSEMITPKKPIIAKKPIIPPVSISTEMITPEVDTTDSKSSESCDDHSKQRMGTSIYMKGRKPKKLQIDRLFPFVEMKDKKENKEEEKEGDEQLVQLQRIPSEIKENPSDILSEEDITTTTKNIEKKMNIEKEDENTLELALTSPLSMAYHIRNGTIILMSNEFEQNQSK